MNIRSAFPAFAMAVLVLLPAGLSVSCTHEPAGIEDLDTVCFDTQILPILQTSCGISGCHDGSSEEFRISDYNSVMEIVTPGDPHGSKLYRVITSINGENLMPPKNPLTREQRTLIQLWIAQGAKNTICGTGSSGNAGGNAGGNATDSVCFVQDILPVILSSCGTTGCHDAATHNEGYILTDYASILSKGIVPHNAASSKIYEVVTDNGEDRMPPAPRAALTSVQIAALRKWIDQGAKNSDCPPGACDTTGTISFTTQVFPILQANCIGCHNNSSANGGVNLSSFSQVKTIAETLRSGTPLLQGTIRRMQGFVAMPQTFALDECSIRKIELWIAQGVQNN